MKEHQILAPYSSSPPIGKGHALSARATTLTPSWILDFGASHHITNTPQLLTSLTPCSSTQIALGNSSQISILGSGTTYLVGGSLQGVLFFPNILMNLLSIYQIFYSRPRKIVKFSPHNLVFQDLHDLEMIVATVSVDSASLLYRFDGFDSSNDIRSCFLEHVDSISRIWHENFGMSIMDIFSR